MCPPLCSSEIWQPFVQSKRPAKSRKTLYDAGNKTAKFTALKFEGVISWKQKSIIYSFKGSNAFGFSRKFFNNRLHFQKYALVNVRYFIYYTMTRKCIRIKYREILKYIIYICIHAFGRNFYLRQNLQCI